VHQFVVFGAHLLGHQHVHIRLEHLLLIVLELLANLFVHLLDVGVLIDDQPSLLEFVHLLYQFLQNAFNLLLLRSHVIVLYRVYLFIQIEFLLYTT